MQLFSRAERKRSNLDLIMSDDYTKPIARRTRGEEALFYKMLWERKKKEEEEKKNVNKSTREREDRGVKSDKLGKIGEKGKKANVSEDLGFGHNLGREYLSISRSSEEDEEGASVEVADYGQSVGVENFGLKNGENSQKGVEGMDYEGPIMVDDDEDSEDGVEILGQGDEMESGGLGADEGKDFIFIGDDDDDVSEDDLEMSIEEDSDDFSDEDYSVSLEGSRSYSEEEEEEEEDGKGETSKSRGDENGKGKKFEVGGNQKFGFYSEEGEEKEYRKSEASKSRGDENGKGKKVEVGVKRKFGLEIAVDSDDEKDSSKENHDSVNASQEHNCLARQTRSHVSSKSIKEKVKLETVSRSLCFDDQLDALSGDDGSGDERELTKHKKGKHACKLSISDVIKTLANSILDEKDVLFASSMNEAPKEERSYPTTEPHLPLKFFGFEDLSQPEKSESEKEMDKLWLEMDFSLRSSEIDSEASNMVGNEIADCPEVQLDKATLCHRGDHHLFLDEEYGVICKFCNFVQQEVKYILPTFNANVWGKLDRRDSGTVDNSIFEDLYCQDSDCDFQSVIDPYAIIQGTVWDMIPGIRNSLYPHQREGFEFLWKNVAGEIDLDKLKNPASLDGGGGCIISHAPGTGKTRLTIVFLQTYMKLYPRCRPVIVAPCSMLLTWEEEFRKWKVGTPFHILNKSELSGKESDNVINYLSQAQEGLKDVTSIRMLKLYSWKKDGGILGISYGLFEKLAGEDETEESKAQKNKGNHKAKDENVRKILLELPGLFVFDEGHTPRNDNTNMWKALSNIKTERRIMLSGTPFQNNFDELFNTLCLVRPKFGDTISFNHRGDHKRRGRKRSEAKGKWASLTSSIGKVADDRLKAEKLKMIRDMIAPFVHVHKGKILQESLPGLRHSVVVLRPDGSQKSLLEGLQGTKNLICLDYYVSLVSVHPSLLPGQCSEKEEISGDRNNLERFRLNPKAGVKTKFVIELLRLSEALGDKVLVFAQYLEPLALIMDQLDTHFNWTQGKEVLYMDGKADVKQRQSSINVFNDPTSEAKVLLASTKACCVGINLVGASRVVLLDVAWNPSVERQAICRAYRLGQKKFVYIYHLITSGTMEEDKFCRQAEKHRMSESLFTPNDRRADQQKIVSTISEDKILEEMFQHKNLKHMFEKIYQQNESDLIETFDLVDL